MEQMEVNPYKSLSELRLNSETTLINVLLVFTSIQYPCTELAFSNWVWVVVSLLKLSDLNAGLPKDVKKIISSLVSRLKFVSGVKLRATTSESEAGG